MAGTNVKRAAEMAAIFMIGDGLLGLLQPARHVALWRSETAAVDALVKRFADRPGRRQAYGALQISIGLLLAARLTRDDTDLQRARSSTRTGAASRCQGSQRLTG